MATRCKLGVVGKRKDSVYEPGKRTGSWIKYRVNRGQEFVIGGYIPDPDGFDSLIVGVYQGKDLKYVARVRNGFVPASRHQVFERICHLVSPIMPFSNLPDKHKSRWGDELTAEKMKECVWLRPEAVAQVEFFGMDGGRLAPAFKICRAARGQESSKRGQRTRKRRVRVIEHAWRC